MTPATSAPASSAATHARLRLLNICRSFFQARAADFARTHIAASCCSAPTVSIATPTIRFGLHGRVAAHSTTSTEAQPAVTARRLHRDGRPVPLGARHVTSRHPPAHRYRSTEALPHPQPRPMRRAGTTPRPTQRASRVRQPHHRSPNAEIKSQHRPQHKSATAARTPQQHQHRPSDGTPARPARRHNRTDRLNRPRRRIPLRPQVQVRDRPQGPRLQLPPTPHRHRRPTRITRT